MNIFKTVPLFISLILLLTGNRLPFLDDQKTEKKPAEIQLRAIQNETEGTIRIYRGEGKEPILVQNAKPDFRPYLHPIVAPDGKGILTEYSPGHHKHQTGIYWGYTRVNGRDYFHHPSDGYWKKISAKVVKAKGPEVKWQTVYDLLDSTGKAVLTETQNWTMRQKNGQYLLDLEWNGEAQTDVTIGKYDYGGLFVRMPWKEGIKGEVINAARQKNEKAEGQAAHWVDIGMQVEGRSDLAHIAILDHKENKGYPQTWRVDSQLGAGPARARKGDWYIKKGETETIRHELVIYTGELNDVELNKTFGEFIGDNGIYNATALWALAQKEGREAKFLNAQEAVAAMTIKDGFQVNAWASEPMMTQPMAFCWDDRGRMWIAENKDYESRGKGFSNAGTSRILILEDTDHDGVADSRKVFAEGIAFPSALAVGFDGVFVGAPPNLLFIPDKDHDDKADMDHIEIRLTGWGIRDRHETLNSFHWGPDGWLYGLQGFATPSRVGKPVGQGKLYKHKDPFPENVEVEDGVDINGGVWRYHPTKKKFEVVAHGFSNPWGVDFDAKGQLFITACVIPHLWYVIPGGIYHRQGGQHFNPYVYNDIKTIADHSHRSAHGGARIYQSDAFPEAEKGKIFMANIHEHGILSDQLIPKGSGFTGKHSDEFMMANNAQWVGFSMEIGPEGAMYVLDWHDADICGSDVLNSETGRIFRITPKKSLASDFPNRYADLTKLSDLELANLQTSKSDWHARRARVILQSRAVTGPVAEPALQKLNAIFHDGNPDERLRAMWALRVTSQLTNEALVASLSDKEPYVRGWAIQFLCEDQNAPANVLAQFGKMAATDPSPVVRLYLAAALQRINAASRWGIAEGLLSHQEDAGDHNLPKMIWFGIEPLVKENPAKALELAAKSRMPMVTQFIARRTVDADQIETLITAIGKMTTNRLQMLEGMRDAMEGRTDLKTPANWTAIYAKLKMADKQTAALATDLNRQFGNTEAAKTDLATLKNKNAPAEQRKKALQSLTARQRPELLAELPALLENPALRAAAIRSAAAFDSEPLAKTLIEKYPQFSPAEKSEAIQTLASRPKSGWLLTQAISKNTIPKKDVPTYVARQLRRVVGSGFVEVWGPIDHVAFDEKAYKKYKDLLSEKSVSAASKTEGRLVFRRTCAPCHKLYGEGGMIGPELTGSNRANLDYLLGNILDPSGEIQDDYKMVVVTMRDGRTYVGNIAKETDRQLTLRIVGQDAVVINKADIQTREVNAASMMPTGLLDNLSDKEVTELIAYLRTNGPISASRK